MSFVSIATRLESTARVSGGLITVESGDTQVSISAGRSIFTNNSNPLAPWSTLVDFGPFTPFTPALLGIAGNTFFSIDNTGSLVQRPTLPNATQSRTETWLGAVVHPGPTIVNLLSTTFTPVSELAITLADFAKAVGDINQEGGNQFTANAGADLTMDKNAGSTFALQRLINFIPDSPNIVASPSLTAVVAPTSYQDGSGGFISTLAQDDLRVAFTDDGSGTLAAVGANEWQNLRVFFVAGPDQTFIQFGQTLYSGGPDPAQDAIDAARNKTEVFERNFQLTEIPPHTLVTVRGGATDLTDDGHARFTQADRFGNF